MFFVENRYVCGPKISKILRNFLTYFATRFFTKNECIQELFRKNLAGSRYTLPQDPRSFLTKKIDKKNVHSHSGMENQQTTNETNSSPTKKSAILKLRYLCYICLLILLILVINNIEVSNIFTTFYLFTHFLCFQI